jgi:hypothetical protein
MEMKGKNQMETKHREFLDQMISQVKTHEEWRTLVDYGLSFLLKDQDVFVELVINEARRMIRQGEVTSVSGVPTEVDAVRQILQELKLRFVAG